MSHPAEHEERIIGYALGDPPDPGMDEEALLVGQLLDCSECLAYGYRALADLPLLVAAHGGETSVTRRAQERCIERLDALLRRAVGELGEMESEEHPREVGKETNWWAEIWSQLRPKVLRPSVGLAMAVLLVALVVTVTQREPDPVDEGFARGQLAEALEALPSGYSFSPGRSLSPFWRGYTMGVLADVEAAQIEDEAAGELRAELLRTAGASEWALLKEKSCEALVATSAEQEACAQGLFAYRVRRTLAEGAEVTRAAGQLLRSSGAGRFLTWASKKISSNPSLAPWQETVDFLEERGGQDDGPGPREISAWVDLIQRLFREG